MTIQIAVKLPDELVGDLDRLVVRGEFDSRSHAVRAGLEAMMAAHKRAATDLLYEGTFSRVPETGQEVAEATRLAIESIHDEPWDPWW